MQRKYYKNVKSVTIPNAGGLKSLQASMLAGLVGDEVVRKLEVLAMGKC